jgi:hypothetical protein
MTASAAITTPDLSRGASISSTPSGAIHDLGRTFLDLAGRPVADIELY